MKTNPILIGVLALLIGFGAGHVSGAWSDTWKAGSGHDMHSDMAARLEDKEGAVFDEAFLNEMIIHHEGAVVMAEVVLEKSERPELKELANDIIAAQTSEIALMRQWLGAWFSAEASVTTGDQEESDGTSPTIKRAPEDPPKVIDPVPEDPGTSPIY